MGKYQIGLFLLYAVVLCMSENWEDISVICPHQCVCQYSHFMDLSIARWIHKIENSEFEDDHSPEYQQNEALFQDDTTFLNNPFVKFIICIIQSENGLKDLITSMPQDVQALILLYTEAKHNITVYTSDLTVFPDLTTLEIRGTVDKKLQLVIDEPLPYLLHANFETIQLSGSENSKRRLISIDPSKNFDYMPYSEKIEYNISLEIEEEIEILPYEVYMLEIHKSKMVSFYGWDSLEVLRIHDSKLDELHWEIFDGLLKLQHLSLELNDIKIIPAFAFYGAMNIRTLSLARNKILNLHYRDLAGLLNLKSLDLSFNNLTKLSELTFPPFPELKIIDIRYNPIKYIFDYTFGVMNSTQTMILGSENVQIDLSSTSPFDSLIALKVLTILNGTTQTLGQKLFKGLVNLEIFKMKGNIKLIEFDAFCGMPNVKELILSYCGIEEISMDAFYGVDKIEIIDLSYNNINTLPPNMFDGKKHLREIYLQNNQLSKLPQSFFHNINSVKLVRLINNPWICTCAMVNWKQSVTNNLKKIVKQKKCVFNYKAGANLLCTTKNSQINYSYFYDNKLSPRCNGGPGHVTNRSVYYALRRDLKCQLNTTLKARNKKVTPKEVNYMIQTLNKGKSYDGDWETSDVNKEKLYQLKVERLKMQKIKFLRSTNANNPNKLHYQLENRNKHNDKKIKIFKNNDNYINSF